ncbi:MAG: PepSY domain-containing protein [Hyphomicrobiales bacterium]|nr:PepSY domain-containing protein [Hyphomicrobiales bacterium]MBV8824118.1 PepSY domain-containing protein [Hyphomicrobiales bacterium]MBV9428366.1 PepSY domain-containing protein [Bradyrhizobiaceae bacterium]
MRFPPRRGGESEVATVRVLVSLHRWLGVAFCLPLAMWFATGIIMHFVPFPSSLGEAERLTGMGLDLARVGHGPAEAVAATGSRGATRVRLIERADGPVYLVTSPGGVKAVRAGDLTDGAIRSEQSALSIAASYARGPGVDVSRAAVAGLAAYDQWTVSGEYDPHRPLYRIALNDGSATELYVSSTTGEVVLESTRHVRGWNYLGSVVHWIYFTGLRSHAAAWRVLLWWLSFLALIGVVAGAIIGPLRLTIEGRRFISPFHGWQAWHHWLGLICMPFIFTWMFSGWLSMDGGLLFSSGKLAPAETTALIGEGRWSALSADEIRRLSTPVQEVLWFVFDDRVHRRELQNIAHRGPQALLRPGEIDDAARHLQRSCEPAYLVASDDAYNRIADFAPGTLVRVICGSDWFDIDATNGTVQKIDRSRRSYRWLYRDLHRFDFPLLSDHPSLRTILIVGLCAGGLIFAFTAVAIGCRRVSLVRRGHNGGEPDG